jgi:hypothetical protein
MSSEMCRSASRRLIIVFGEAVSLHASLTCVSSASSGPSSDDGFRRGRLRDGPKPSEPPCFLRNENGRYDNFLRAFKKSHRNRPFHEGGGYSISMFRDSGPRKACLRQMRSREGIASRIGSGDIAIDAHLDRRPSHARQWVAAGLNIAR